MKLTCCYLDVFNVERWTDIPYIGVAESGFWVDNNWQYCVFEGSRCWIPPSRIKGVVKETA